jgi:hypothetical protein
MENHENAINENSNTNGKIQKTNKVKKTDKSVFFEGSINN